MVSLDSRITIPVFLMKEGDINALARSPDTVEGTFEITTSVNGMTFLTTLHLVILSIARMHKYQYFSIVKSI